MIKTQQLYDYAKIADETGLDPALLRLWNKRGKLPAPDYRVGQSPAWKPATIQPWIADRAATAPAGPGGADGSMNPSFSG